MLVQVGLFLEVEELADERSELEVTSGELNTAGVETPGPVRVARDGPRREWNGAGLS